MRHSEENKLFLVKTLEGELTFVLYSDPRLRYGFEIIKSITIEEHYNILNFMNKSCKWYEKADFIDGKLVKVKRWSEEEITKRYNETREKVFKEERELAVLVMQDFYLGIGNISNQDFMDVKRYLKALEYSKYDDNIDRPLVLSRY